MITSVIIRSEVLIITTAEVHSFQLSAGISVKRKCQTLDCLVRLNMAASYPILAISQLLLEDGTGAV